MSIEVQKFEELTFDEGAVWVGDITELLPRKEWKEILLQCNSIQSFKGWVVNKNGGVEFLVINAIDAKQQLFLVKDKGRSFNDVALSNNYFIVVHENDMDLMSKKEIDELESGEFLELHEAGLVTIKGTHFTIGTRWSVER